MSSSANGVMIIVHYGDVTVTIRLLDSLTRIKRIDELDVLVVDNDLKQNRQACLEDYRLVLPRMRVLKPKNNSGYFGGAKTGLNWYLSDGNKLPKWTLISNNDIIFEDPLFLEKLFVYDSQSLGILAPRILSTRTGCNQNPFLRNRPGRRRIRELQFWLKNYHLALVHEQLSYSKHVIRGWLRRRERELAQTTLNTQEAIYAPHGSFLILSRTFFERGGALDDSQFLYTEEITLAETCRKINLPVSYDPQLVVIHDEHCTTGRKYNQVTYSHQKNAMDYLTSGVWSDVL